MYHIMKDCNIRGEYISDNLREPSQNRYNQTCLYPLLNNELLSKSKINERKRKGLLIQFLFEMLYANST